MIASGSAAAYCLIRPYSLGVRAISKAALLLLHVRDVSRDISGVFVAQRIIWHPAMRQQQERNNLVEIDIFRVCYGLE